MGIYALKKGLEHRVHNWQREIGSPYTTEPTEPYVGQHPGRDERRGVWTTDQIRAAEAANQLEKAQADAGGGYLIISHTYSVENNPGNSFPWEGSSGAGGGETNTGNGNHLMSLPLFKWKTRGGMTLDITLYNNCETTYEDELGKGWTWSYDLYINNLTSSPTMHWATAWRFLTPRAAAVTFRRQASMISWSRTRAARGPLRPKTKSFITSTRAASAPRSRIVTATRSISR